LVAQRPERPARPGERSENANERADDLPMFVSIS
jgi:hypothetical protein